MKNQKNYVNSLALLITGLSLFTGAICAVFFFYFIAQQNVTPPPPPFKVPPIRLSPSPSPTHTPNIPPTTDTKACGGIAGRQCPSGYTCKLTGNYPDAGGTCITKETKPEEETVMCTMDAKQCLDGSFVGRSGPNCEFAKCPNPQ